MVWFSREKPAGQMPAWHLIALLFALCLSLGSFAVTAHAQNEDEQARLDLWNAAIERVNTGIRRLEVSDPELRDMRGQVSTVMEEASAFAAQLAPEVAAAAAQIKTLSPASGSNETLSDAIKAELQVAEKTYADLSGSQRQAQAIVARGAATLAKINDRRRQMFTARLLQHGSSIIDPQLWLDASAEAPNFAGEIGDIVVEWSGAIGNNADRSAVAVIGLFLVTLGLAVIPGRRVLLRRLWRPAKDAARSRRDKVLAGTAIVAINTLVPATALFAGHALLQSFDLVPERISEIWFSLSAVVIVFCMSLGIARALLAPGHPELRLVSLDDALAGRIYRLVVTIAFIQSLAIFINRLTRITATAPPFTIVIAGILTISSAVLIIITVRALNRRPDASEGDEEEEGESGSALRRAAFVLASIAAAAAIAACLLGFIAFGRFITTQVAWAATVFSLLFLLTALLDELTAAWFRRQGAVGSRLISSVGFAPRSLTQLGVVFNGVARVILTAIALLSVIAPWGFDSDSVFVSIRQVFVGFTIGSIVVSPSTLLTALVVFAAGLVATRALQQWLETRFLPTTRLDSGLRNSIRTSIGHVGWILAAVVAFTYAGLDLSSIAIVAGALSVGIGLGLQGIVNNFVSGLILLAERPIRAGDWISVGAEEGIVKRINVRATEIETFDRATVIVPNSSLITGVVKNMVLHDRSGRAIVKIMVAKTADPQIVRDVLMTIAKAHPLVLSFPEPLVLFTDFDASSLRFELICYVTDNGKGGIVRSDIRFQCFIEFGRNGIELPPAFPGDVASPPQIGEHSPMPNR